MSLPRAPMLPGDYVVGRGRPPVASRFKPGQSGNPKGQPRKGQDLAVNRSGFAGGSTA